MRLINDMRKAYVKIPPKVLNYVARDPVINKSKIAEAAIITSLPNRLLINFYLKISKPKVPAKAFSDVEAATEWLNTKEIRPDQL